MLNLKAQPGRKKKLPLKRKLEKGVHTCPPLNLVQKKTIFSAGILFNKKIHGLGSIYISSPR